ncbi:unnamed protein product [marine sediment metagenome]|uniref:Uncharacterized protein n=1 Tax=marine sediment metagenome TaxID=412755 RepID=X1BKU8_9ZZZZ
MYPWIERSITLAQSKELNSKYIDIDTTFPNIDENYNNVILKLEEQINAGSLIV